MKKLITIFLILCAAAFPGLAFAGPRYISLAPSTTEILFSLGLSDNIVGVSSYCNYPSQVKDKERVGTFSQPNIEKIISLKPDYIFCTGLEQASVVAELRRLDLNVYVSDPGSTRELFSSIAQIGRITGKQKEAEALVKAMQTQISEVGLKLTGVSAGQRPRVFIEIWYDPLTTAGEGTFVDELITLAGGVNISKGTRRAYSIFSPEEVIRRDPERIVLAYMSEKNSRVLLSKRFGWSGISAVRNNRIYNDINPDLLLRPGPRITEGLRELHERFYR